MCDQAYVPYWFLWKTELPYKIKVFLWLVMRNKIITKDNLKKETGKDQVNASFVSSMNWLTTYFLSVRLPDMCGW